MTDLNSINAAKLPELGEANIIQVSPTMGHRWSNGLLEQRFEVLRFKNGRTVAVEHEWRPVPIVEDVTDGPR